MIDCIVIGMNMPETPSHVELVRSVDNNGGAWRDLRLAFVEHNDSQYTALDLINEVYRKHNPKFGSAIDETETDLSGQPDPFRPFNNLDFLWPAVSYLTTFLRKRNFNTEWINLFQQEKDRLKTLLTTEKVRAVAVTTTLYVTPQPMIEIIQFVKSLSPETQVIVGGPYIAGQADLRSDEELYSLFSYLGADIYVISSEGEQTLAKILTALRREQPLSDINNLLYKNRNTISPPFIRTEKAVENNALEDEPVDYALFPKKQLSQFISLRTAKSCPYSCAFCGFPQRAGAYKTLSPELVEEELNRIADLGCVDTLTFLDDTFNVPKKRFKDILKMMIRRNYGFKWNSFYRSDQGDEETIHLMREAGCEGVFLGVESGSDTLLKNMNKTARRKHFAAAIPQLQAAGISAHASLIIGFPGETEATIRETQSLIEEAKPDFFRAQLWYCDPLTPIWKNREQYGLTGNGFSWKHDTMDSDTASDWVERLFFDTRNSTWLPQHGFEQWSTFYLQRRGYSKQQVIDYIALFNMAVKAQLTDSSLKSIPESVIDAIENLLIYKQTDTQMMSSVHHTATHHVKDDAMESFAF